MSRSPTRGGTASPPPKPLSPCLVHRIPASLSHSTPLKPLRRSSQPPYDPNSIIQRSRHKDSPPKTVPLRECCAKCESITEQCLKAGALWQEKFSRGARRRRSQSLDDARRREREREQQQELAPSLSRLRTDPSACLVDDSELTLMFRPPTFALTVDEVDKRRKSLDLTADNCIDSCYIMSEDSDCHPSSSNLYSPQLPCAPTPGKSTRKTHPVLVLGPRTRSSPILEEEEDQLFPLPSPKRSPSGTPDRSPIPSAKNSPLQSPATSATSLVPPPPSLPSLSQLKPLFHNGHRHVSAPLEMDSSWSSFSSDSTSTSSVLGPATPTTSCESHCHSHSLSSSILPATSRSSTDIICTTVARKAHLSSTDGATATVPSIKPAQNTLSNTNNSQSSLLRPRTPTRSQSLSAVDKEKSSQMQALSALRRPLPPHPPLPAASSVSALSLGSGPASTTGAINSSTSTVQQSVLSLSTSNWTAPLRRAGSETMVNSGTGTRSGSDTTKSARSFTIPFLRDALRGAGAGIGMPF